MATPPNKPTDVTAEISAVQLRERTSASAPQRHPIRTPAPEQRHTVAANSPAPAASAGQSQDRIIGVSNKFSHDVELLQERLIAEGFLAPGKKDGRFGTKETLPALHAYQDAHGMPRSDTFNMKDLAPPSAISTDLAQNTTRTTITIGDSPSQGLKRALAEYNSKPALPGLGQRLQLAMDTTNAPARPAPAPVALHVTHTDPAQLGGLAKPTQNNPAQATTRARSADDGRGQG